MRKLIAQPIWGVECDFSLVPTCLGLVEGVAPAFVTFMISTNQVDCCRECCLHILAAMKHAPCVNVPVIIPDELENELQAQGRKQKWEKPILTELGEEPPANCSLGKNQQGEQ